MRALRARCGGAATAQRSSLLPLSVTTAFSSSSSTSSSLTRPSPLLLAARAPRSAAAPAPSRHQSRCRAAAAAAPSPNALNVRLSAPGLDQSSPTVVYKFGGSSVADAARMREVADIVCSFPEHLPVIVLSAMGKTTNLLLAAGQEALQQNPASVPSMAPLRAVKELHRATAQELGVDSKTVDAVEALLAELTQLLVGVSITQELTARARDSLVSFGERLSTRLFAAFLRASGVPARNVDAWDAGLTTCDAFGSATVDYEASLPALRAALSPAPKDAPVAVFTGFLGRGSKTKAITTLGRGGSDLTCTLLGAALGLPEVQVWKDVDGVLTADPRLVKRARAVDALTYDEATELAFFGAAVLHPLAMQPAIQASLAAAQAESSDSASTTTTTMSRSSSSGASSSSSSGNDSNGASTSSSSSPFVPTPLAVRVKNSYNRTAPGTIIAADRDMSSSLVTSVVLKDGVTMLDMVSTAAPGQVGFLANVFAAFRDCGVSVDVVATSEVSVSLTLDPSRVWERDLVDAELDALLSSLSRFAAATATRNVGCVSLICNVARTAEILERAFGVLKREEIPVLMMSQGASKTNISLIVGGGGQGKEGEEGAGPKAIKALHAEFFE